MNGFSSSLSNETSTQDKMPDLEYPPWVEVQGIDNFRDIGGYALASDTNHSVRRNFCYRCADPARLNEAGRAKILELGITDIYDLRSSSEVEKNTAALRGTSTPQNDATPSTPTTIGSEHVAPRAPFADLHGVTHRFTPVFKHRDFSPEAMANYTRGGQEGFTAAYKDILENAGPALKLILTHVRDRPEDPLLLHCSAGKDRTGVLVAILMKLAGCKDSVIAKEYELTEIGLAPMLGLIMAHLKKQPMLDTDDEGIKRMVSAKSENMMAALAMLQKEFGGAEQYVKNTCGLTDQDISRIRANLIADTSPIF